MNRTVNEISPLNSLITQTASYRLWVSLYALFSVPLTPFEVTLFLLVLICWGFLWGFCVCLFLLSSLWNVSWGMASQLKCILITNWMQLPARHRKRSQKHNSGDQLTIYKLVLHWRVERFGTQVIGPFRLTKPEGTGRRQNNPLSKAKHMGSLKRRKRYWNAWETTRLPGLRCRGGKSLYRRERKFDTGAEH